MKKIVLARFSVLLWVLALLGVACASDTSNQSATTTETSLDSTSSAAPTTSTHTTTTNTTEIAWPHDWNEPTVGGGQFNAADYAGQDLILWFWAPW